MLIIGFYTRHDGVHTLIKSLRYPQNIGMNVGNVIFEPFDFGRCGIL